METIGQKEGQPKLQVAGAIFDAGLGYLGATKDYFLPENPDSKNIEPAMESISQAKQLSINVVIEDELFVLN